MTFQPQQKVQRSPQPAVSSVEFNSGRREPDWGAGVFGDARAKPREVPVRHYDGVGDPLATVQGAPRPPTSPCHEHLGQALRVPWVVRRPRAVSKLG